MAANLRDPGSIPGGDPKRFQDSSNYVFYIVRECFSSAADTHLATDLTCKTHYTITCMQNKHHLITGLIKPYIRGKLGAETDIGDACH